MRLIPVGQDGQYRGDHRCVHRPDGGGLRHLARFVPPMKSLPPIFSFVVVLFAGSAQAQDPVARGQALVAQFCGRCHAIGVKGKSRHCRCASLSGRSAAASILMNFHARSNGEFRAATPTCPSSNSATTTRLRFAPICV